MTKKNLVALNLSSNRDLLQRFSDDDAERALLGILLKHNDLYDEIVATLTEKSFFFSARHRAIFDAIKSIYERGDQADVITVPSMMMAYGSDKEIKPYVASLAQHAPPSERAVSYAKIIVELAKNRRVFESLASTIDTMVNPVAGKETASDILSFAENKLYGLRASFADRTAEVKTMRDAVIDVVRDMEIAQNSDRRVVGLETGLDELDDLITGLHPGDYMIVAGRPSMGKTALAINITEHVAYVEQLPVLVYSIEMSAKSLAARQVSSVAEIDSKLIRTGSISTESDWEAFESAIGKLTANENIMIDETPAINIVEMRARSRRMSKKLEAKGQKLALIVIDYLQLVTAYGSNENDRTTEVSHGLKAMAKENNCAVIALSQLNRALELRNDKRPMMSDLRSSGAIEQDADIIAFIYRDEVYHPDTDMPGVAELIIGKQRNGATGDVMLNYQGQYTKFSTWRDD